MMEKRTEEWLRQSDYDMDTADYMFEGGRYLYAVFMCHLAVEKDILAGGKEVIAWIRAQLSP